MGEKGASTSNILLQIMGDNLRPIKIYDPERGRFINLAGMINRLGMQAVAKKYKVTESAVWKWKKGIRNPSKRTLSKTWKELF